MEETAPGSGILRRIGDIFGRSARFVIAALFCATGFLASQAHPAEAASLFFSPSSGSYAVGQSFSVGIYVSSRDQAENAVSGVVSFPADKLAVTSLSKGGSVVGLWVQEPAFSQSAGTVNFEGVTPNPGYTGSSGKIIEITFKAKAQGAADVRLTSGAILANDGQGTNILSGLGSAAFKIGEAAPSPAPAPAPTPGPKPGVAPSPAPTPEAAGKPPTPVISSPSHPDPESWSDNPDVVVEWPLPQGVDGVSWLLDQNPTTDSGTTSFGLFPSRTLKRVKDGTWYFHLRFHNSAGWGPAAHFRFKILTQKAPSQIATESARRFAAVMLVLMLALLMALLIFTWRQLIFRKRVHTGVDDAQKELHKSFNLLEEDIREQIRLLEKTKSRRELTTEEDRILKKLRDDLRIAEDQIQKKIRKIEKGMG